jgi:hypothetical protein
MFGDYRRWSSIQQQEHVLIAGPLRSDDLDGKAPGRLTTLTKARTVQ